MAGITDDGTIEVSAGAQTAIRSAIASLEPYRAEPRIEALVSKLGAIAEPADGFAANDYGRDEAVAKAMADADRLAKSEDGSPAIRDRARAASLELQRAHLAKHSGAAAVWERAAQEAGLVA
jgi:hypothetical protein